MNKLILFNEPVKSVRKSQQTIHSRIGIIRLQLFSSRQLTDSNDPFRASLQWTELTSFDSPQKAEDFISSLSQRKTYAEALQSNGKAAAIISSTRRGRSQLPGRRWWQGGDGYLLNLFFFFFFFFPLSPWDTPGFLFIRHNCLFAGKTNTLFSFLEGTNGE